MISEFDVKSRSSKNCTGRVSTSVVIKTRFLTLSNAEDDDIDDDHDNHDNDNGDDNFRPLTAFLTSLHGSRVSGFLPTLRLSRKR